MTYRRTMCPAGGRVREQTTVSADRVGLRSDRREGLRRVVDTVIYHGGHRSVTHTQGQVQGIREQRVGDGFRSRAQVGREAQGGGCRHQETGERRHRQDQDDVRLLEAQRFGRAPSAQGTRLVRGTRGTRAEDHLRKPYYIIITIINYYHIILYPVFFTSLLFYVH